TLRNRDAGGLAGLQRELDAAELELITVSNEYDGIVRPLRATLQAKLTTLQSQLTTLEEDLADLAEQLKKGPTIAELEMGGTNNMTTSINAHIARLNEQIADIQRKLSDSAVPARGLPSAIVDIDKDRNIIHIDESEMRAGSSKGAQQDEGGADVWTKIAFN
ncbi:hypothetical protein EDB80DRAFT_532320, partial [Ilyonectria destructans]